MSGFQKIKSWNNTSAGRLFGKSSGTSNEIANLLAEYVKDNNLVNKDTAKVLVSIDEGISGSTNGDIEYGKRVVFVELFGYLVREVNGMPYKPVKYA